MRQSTRIIHLPLLCAIFLMVIVSLLRLVFTTESKSKLAKVSFLTLEDIERHCDRLSLSRAARELIKQAAMSNPLAGVPRMPGRRRYRYPSRKMMQAIEAKPAEFVALHHLDWDGDVLAFWSRKIQIKHDYLTKAGKPTGQLYIPFALVMREDSVGFEEWLTEQELENLSERSPERYHRDTDGQWRCPPGERFAAAYGFYYHVHSQHEINWTLQRNYELLAAYGYDDCPQPSYQAGQEILERIQVESGVLLSDLIDDLQHATVEDVYKLILNERIFVDLYAAPLADPDLVRIFRSASDAAIHVIVAEEMAGSCHLHPNSIAIVEGEPVLWDGNAWMIANVGQNNVTLIATDRSAQTPLPWPTFQELVQSGAIRGLRPLEQAELSDEARELLMRASITDRQEALHKYRIIRPDLEDRLPSDREQKQYAIIPERTRRDWKSKYRAAKLKYGVGLLGLLPRHARKGRRGERLPVATVELLNRYIEQVFETPVRRRMAHVYRLMADEGRKNGIYVPRYKTFARRVRQRRLYEQILKRLGHKSAEQVRPWFWYLGPGVPQLGDFPFHICYEDHTQLDIEIRCSRTGRNLGRPWLSLLICAFTRRVLAIYVSFEEPSYRCTMMLLRECYRRFGRLPQTLVLDCGSDFNSIYVETLLALFEITKMERPVSQPRSGSVIENLFDVTNDQFVHNVTGNTQASKNPRQITKKTDPKRLAIWPLGNFTARLREYLYEIYDTRDHSTLGQSPREAFIEGLRITGERRHLQMWSMEDLTFETLPTTDKGTAKIQVGRGIKINHIYYYHPDFDDADVRSTNVDVRYDPFDMGVAYAYIKGRWMRCQCLARYYQVLRGRSEYQIAALTAEFRQRRRLQNRDADINDEKLVEFIRSVEAEEAILTARLRELANVDARAVMAGRPLDHEAYVITPSGSNQPDDVVATLDSDDDIDEDDDLVFGTYTRP